MAYLLQFTVIMHVKKSLIVPVAVIFSGVLMQLKALGIFGNFLPDDLPGKLWPLLIAAVALDLLFSQRRLVASSIMLFFAAALLAQQFPAGRWSTDLWDIFLKFWPILLILFGIDCIFSGRSVINAAVVIIVILIGVYVLLTTLDLPVLDKLPISLPSITAIIPTSEFSGTMPGRPQPQPQQQPGVPGPQNGPAAQEPPSAIITGPGGQTIIPMPSRNSAAQLNLNAASGKITVKSGAASDSFLSGTITLDSRERLDPQASLNGPTAVYTLSSTGSAAAPNISNWDLALSSQISTALNAVLESGYFKADLRGMDLSSVNVENKYGPIDIMMPMITDGGIRIKAGNGDIRVYVPRGVRISSVISGTDLIEYPQRNYTFSNNTLTPRSALQTPIRMEIISNGGRVQIIESE